MYTSVRLSKRTDYTHREMVWKGVRVITHVYVTGTILSEDHKPQMQSISDCHIPGCIMCQHSNHNLYSNILPIHYPLCSHRPPALHFHIQREESKQTNKKQIPRMYCEYGVQSNSIFISLLSQGSKTHTKAICTEPHPIEE